jgi:hypothetical protein
MLSIFADKRQHILIYWQIEKTLYQVNRVIEEEIRYLFIYLALPTRAGSPQQHMPITVGPFYLTHPVNFPCGRKPEYPGKTHDFRQSVDFLLFSHEDWVRVALRKFLVRFGPAASEVKGKCANHLATEAPCMANYLRTRLHFLIGLVGFLAFCFGIFILASARLKIRNILTGELKYFINYGSNTCQYWAGIPVRLRIMYVNPKLS